MIYLCFDCHCSPRNLLRYAVKIQQSLPVKGRIVNSKMSTLFIIIMAYEAVIHNISNCGAEAETMIYK